MKNRKGIKIFNSVPCVYGPPPMIEEQNEPRIIHDSDVVCGPPPMIEKLVDEEIDDIADVYGSEP